MEPESTHSPSSSRALHFSEATSEPESGSDMAMASVAALAHVRPGSSRFCSSVPNLFSAPTTISVTP